MKRLLTLLLLLSLSSAVDGAGFERWRIRSSTTIQPTLNRDIALFDSAHDHEMVISITEDFSADRTLSLDLNDADRTLTIAGAATISGTNTGDVTLAGTPDYITLSGQVITRTKLDPADDLNTFASSVLAGLVTDETGTGAVVLGTSPTITTGMTVSDASAATTAVKIENTDVSLRQIQIRMVNSSDEWRIVQVGDAFRIRDEGNSLNLFALSYDARLLEINSGGDMSAKLSFDADRNGEGENLGEFQAQWDNNTVAQVLFKAGSDTTNKDNGEITFNTTDDGSAPGQALRIDSLKNVVIGSAAIATTATDGFLYVPGCAGTPTGTPTTRTGRAPIVVDTTNHKLYFYSGGAWRDAGP